MVVIRLQRRGTKKMPHHRIIVADRTRAQSGRVLETLGHYDPSCNPPKFSLNQPRMVHWISTGAQVSQAVYLLVKRFQKAPASVAKG